MDQSLPPLDVVQVGIVLGRGFNQPVPLSERVPIGLDRRFVGSDGPEIKLKVVLKRRLFIYENSISMRKRGIPVVEPQRRSEDSMRVRAHILSCRTAQDNVATHTVLPISTGKLLNTHVSRNTVEHGKHEHNPLQGTACSCMGGLCYIGQQECCLS